MCGNNVFVNEITHDLGVEDVMPSPQKCNLQPACGSCMYGLFYIYSEPPCGICKHNFLYSGTGCFYKPVKDDEIPVVIRDEIRILRKEDVEEIVQRMVHILRNVDFVDGDKSDIAIARHQLLAGTQLLEKVRRTIEMKANMASATTIKHEIKEHTNDS